MSMYLTSLKSVAASSVTTVSTHAMSAVEAMSDTSLSVAEPKWEPFGSSSTANAIPRKQLQTT